MTLVVVPRYEFTNMVEIISRYKISHLLYVLLHEGWIQLIASSLVPPQAVSFCKVRLQRNAWKLTLIYE